MLKLGVNIDHIATVRQARKAAAPRAARRRPPRGEGRSLGHHRAPARGPPPYQDADIRELAAHVKNLNMEMAVTRRDGPHRLRGQAATAAASCRRNARS